MLMSTEHSLKFAPLHRQWWRLHMSEQFLSGTKKKQNKQTNKQTNYDVVHVYCGKFIYWWRNFSDKLKK